VSEKERIKDILKKAYGDFASYLELKYEEKIIHYLLEGTAYEKYKWITYNQTLVELKNVVKDELKVKELLYKLTENTDANKACIEVLDKLTTKNKEINRLYNKIINFKLLKLKLPNFVAFFILYQFENIYQ